MQKISFGNMVRRLTSKGATSGSLPSQDATDEQLVPIKDNGALAMAEFKAGMLRVSSTPPMLTLETTSRCNLRCVMCPHGIGDVHRPKHLEEPLIKALQRFIGQATTIQLHGIGEPLVSPAFWSSLKFIPAGCDASINTNFTVLDERRLEQLVSSNINVVNVSLDAATAATYKHIRGFEFATVVENLRRFVERRRAAGRRTPTLYMNMTLMRANIEEVPAFVELAADIGADGVVLWHLNRWSNREMRRYRIERDGWLFDYAAQGLWNFPELSNRMIREGKAIAESRAIHLHLDHNKNVFFQEGKAA